MAAEKPVASKIESTVTTVLLNAETSKGKVCEMP
jgi:hypothetical protein